MIPDIIPVSCEPSPLNCVAVTTPTAFIPPARTLIPVLAVTIPRESTFLTSSYVKVPPILTSPENVAAAATIFLIVMSSEFVRTTAPVLPKTDVTKFVVFPPLSPAKPICLT